jgi:hypothetical protein
VALRQRCGLVIEDAGGSAAATWRSAGTPSGHIVTLRGDPAAGMDVYLAWDAARRAAGLDPSE